MSVEQNLARKAAHAKGKAGKILRFDADRARGRDAPLRPQNRIVAVQKSRLPEHHREIDFVDGAGSVDQVSEMVGDALAVARKEHRSLGRLPSAARREPSRRREMMHRDDGGEPVAMAGFEHAAVMIELSDRKLTGRRLNAGPFDGEAIGVEAEAGKQCDVVGVTMVVIAGVARGFHKDGALKVFEQPEIGIGVGALDLVRGGGGAPAETGWKFHGDRELPFHSG
jgi:hypothetical protein